MAGGSRSAPEEAQRPSQQRVPMQAVSVQGPRANTVFVVPEGWEPLRLLGAGAYAAVAAFRSPSGHHYAVKKIHRVFDHGVLALRTLREVRLLAHFRHPNVLGIRRLFVDGPNFRDVHLCLEAMDGDLHQLIRGSKQPLDDNQVQCVLYQILRGLLCLRMSHVVHRDLKPGNVLVRADGEVKIADLGLSRAIDAGDDGEGEEAEVLTEYVVTRYYRAPEVVLTATRYTYAVDVWSTGCILGEMLARQPLFQGKDALDQIRKIVCFLGPQSPEDMAWLPSAGASWKFVERCNQQADGRGLRQLLRWPGANPLATDLVAQMLRFDPARRISVDEALEHEYLGSFEADTDPEVAAARAVTPVDWSFDRDLCYDDRGGARPYEVGRFRRALLEAADLVERGARVAAAASGESSCGPRRAADGGASPSDSCGRAAGKPPTTAAAIPPAAAPIRAADGGAGRRRAERAR